MSNNLVINNLFQALEDKEASNINGGDRKHKDYKSGYKKRRHKLYSHYHYSCYGRNSFWKYDKD